MEFMNKVLQDAYNGSYYTIIGAGGELSEWKKSYTDMLKAEGIGKPKKWVSFKGADVNEEFGLTGDNRYPDDLAFLAFPLDGLDVGKLVMFRLMMNDRWFVDIVDYDLRMGREG